MSDADGNTWLEVQWQRPRPGYANYIDARRSRSLPLPPSSTPNVAPSR